MLLVRLFLLLRHVTVFDNAIRNCHNMCYNLKSWLLQVPFT